jgi:cardiolipin synthase A/B
VLLEPPTWGLLFVISEWVIRIGALAILPARRSPAAAKTWLLLIFFEPWLGLVLYRLIGRNTLPSWRQDRIDGLSQVFGPVLAHLAEHPNITHPELEPELRQAVCLAANLGHLPILDGNDAELLSDYQGTIDRLVADIDAATNHVHLLYYIFAVDDTTQRVIAALARATKRGVRCRVLVDTIGSRPYSRALLPRLTGAGVEVHKVLPVGFFLRKAGRFDLRNHRKIAVIDGRIGYIGSQNLVSPEYTKDIIYEELVARVTGSVVLELQYIFAADWYLETDEVLDNEAVFPPPALTGSVSAQTLPSGPGYPTENNQRLIVALIHAARKKVVITTPYFIPDEPLLQAMQTAVLRGAEVHLIVSRKADQVLVSLAQKSYYGQLLDAGVQVHLYRKNFLHAKHLSVDDTIALIGSSNIDLRSFTLNAEVSLLFYHEGVTALLRREEARYLEHADLLSAAAWEARPLWKKVGQAVARLFSPLL